MFSAPVSLPALEGTRSGKQPGPAERHRWGGNRILRGELVSGCLNSARTHGLNYDLLDAIEMKQRFPQFVLTESEVAFYEQQSGHLRPEECIKQHLECASKRGADLRFEEPILSWTAAESGDGVKVITEKDTYRAQSLIIAAGPWASELIPSLPVSLTVSRRVMFWLSPVNQRASFDKSVFPIFIWEPAEGPLFYGFPRTHETGEPKVAIHSEGEDCTPSTIDRNIHPPDEAAIRSAIRFRIPALNGTVSRAATCMYTMTPNRHFVIEAIPAILRSASPRVFPVTDSSSRRWWARSCVISHCHDRLQVISPSFRSPAKACNDLRRPIPLGSVRLRPRSIRRPTYRAHVGARNVSQFWDRVLRLLKNVISEATGTLLPHFRKRVFRLWRP